jgi:hypothetical protein
MHSTPETVEKSDQEADPSVEVSRWLQDVGRRKWNRSQRVGPDESVVAQAPRTSSTPLVRRTLLLALLLVASLQYVYAFTTVEILSLPSLLVFVFTG